MESDSDFPLDIQLAEEFLLLASERIHGLVGSSSADVVGRRFRAHFGVSYQLCSHLWKYLEDTEALSSYEVKKVHLLWTLDLLKGDDSENKLKGRWDADEKTLRKWTSLFIEKISDLGVVSRLRALFVFRVVGSVSHRRLIPFCRSSVVSHRPLMPSHRRLPLTDLVGEPSCGFRQWANQYNH
jgi:hypothetical protein